MSIEQGARSERIVSLERDFGHVEERQGLVRLQCQCFAKPLLRCDIIALQSGADTGIRIRVFRRGIQRVLQCRGEIFHRLFLALALAEEHAVVVVYRRIVRVDLERALEGLLGELIFLKRHINQSELPVRGSKARIGADRLLEFLHRDRHLSCAVIRCAEFRMHAGPIFLGRSWLARFRPVRRSRACNERGDQEEREGPFHADAAVARLALRCVRS